MVQLNKKIASSKVTLRQFQVFRANVFPGRPKLKIFSISNFSQNKSKGGDHKMSIQKVHIFSGEGGKVKKIMDFFHFYNFKLMTAEKPNNMQVTDIPSNKLASKYLHSNLVVTRRNYIPLHFLPFQEA